VEVDPGESLSRMQVTAFNTPKDPSWRWRIVNYAGEMIEESDERFPSIVAAVAQGAKRLTAMNASSTARSRSTGAARPPTSAGADAAG
jgi:hypothetical protein